MHTKSTIHWEKKKKAIYQKYYGYTWGMGIEHEVHMFHEPRKEYNQVEQSIHQRKESTLSKVSPIIACNVTHAIRRVLDRDQRLKEKGKKGFLPPHVRTLLEAVPSESSGRKCAGKWALRRLPVLMPEFITRSGTDRNPFIKIKSDRPKKAEWMVHDLFAKEDYIMKLIQKYDPITKKRIHMYGDLISHPIGMSSQIRVPEMYAKKFQKQEGDLDFDKPYTFEKEKNNFKLYKDYTGSYHVTITLPYHKETSQDDFIQMHINFANTIQWIEPLLLTSYFSGDDRVFATNKKYPRGSFRVMRVGWGNFAGADVRQFNKGIGRYAVIPTYWRDGLHFDDMKELSYCDKMSNAILTNSPRAVSSFSSDFRTFGSSDPLRPWHRESGLGMTKPNGIEIRIFDHFRSDNIDDINSLIVLLCYLAENSRISPPSNYVYQNKAWIQCMHNCMKYGYRAEIPDAYVQELQKQLGLPIQTTERNGYRFFSHLIQDLIHKNCRGEWSTIMLARPYLNFKLPQINQNSWRMSFYQFWNDHPDKIIPFRDWLIHNIHELNGQSIKKLNKLCEKKFGKGMAESLYDIWEWFDLLLQRSPIIKKIGYQIHRNSQGYIDSIQTGPEFANILTLLFNKTTLQYSHLGMFQIFRKKNTIL